MFKVNNPCCRKFIEAARACTRQVHDSVLKEILRQLHIFEKIELKKFLVLLQVV